MYKRQIPEASCFFRLTSIKTRSPVFFFLIYKRRNLFLGCASAEIRTQALLVFLYKRPILAAGLFFCIPAFVNLAAGASFWNLKCRTLAADDFIDLGVPEYYANQLNLVKANHFISKSASAQKSCLQLLRLNSIAIV